VVLEHHDRNIKFRINKVRSWSPCFALLPHLSAVIAMYSRRCGCCV
jgi:hypothetical protein